MSLFFKLRGKDLTAIATLSRQAVQQADIIFIHSLLRCPKFAWAWSARKF